MKLTGYLRILAFAVPLLLSACGSHKKVVKTTTTSTEKTDGTQAFLRKVQANAQSAQFLTSKLKLSITAGGKDISLTGNLKMKRNDVIRLQLMALGFVEAGRLEITQDYVLIMDRINKQYVKASYNNVDFLRQSGLNFQTLQALFWNELFIPGQTTVEEQDLAQLKAVLGGENAVISYEKGKLLYSWNANEQTGNIHLTNILYKDPSKGNVQLNWNYQNFRPLAKKQFPNAMNVAVTSAGKEVKMDMTLNALSNDSDWETRTTISKRYTEVTADEILHKLMTL